MASADGPSSVEISPEFIQSVAERLAWMEKSLGIDPKELDRDSDWMLIVKLHAMVETGLNAALVKHFDAPELADIIARLDTSNTATGKVAFAKSLKILDPPSAVYVQKLSELRNFCVHDVRNFGFQLETYLAALRDDKRKELLKPLLKLVKPEYQKSVSLRDMLFVGIMQVMFALEVHELRCENRDLKSKILRAKSARFDEQQESTPKKE